MQPIPLEDLEVSHVLVVSTAHLTCEEGTGGLEEPVQGAYTSMSGEGLFEIVLSDSVDDDAPDPSPGLAGVIAVAKSHGLRRVRFDRDACELPGVPTYSW